MADIFRKTNDDREVAAGLKPPAKAASSPEKPPVDFTRPLPKDPEKEAARAAAKLRLLRARGDV